jgi:ppGpp synthetase/RelA/SpoT-type nucleotidyltranferase
MDQDTQLDIDATNLSALAREAEEQIRKHFYGNTIIEKYCFHVKSRQKRKSRIIEKVRSRRANGREDYSVSDVTDACGFRMISLFLGDIHHIVTELISIIKNKNNNFVSLKEIILYTSRPEEDLLSIDENIKAVASSHGLNGLFKIDRRKSLYSSLHMVAEYSVPNSEYGKNIFFEIQVRSAFEDVWGEIEHKLKYSQFRGSSDGMSWARHLNALKALVDGCAQYVEVIRGQALDAMPEAAPTDDSKSIDTDGDIFSNFCSWLSLDPNGAELSEIKNAYELRDSAKIKEEERARLNTYKLAADSFRSLFEKYDDGSGSFSGGRHDALYFLKMEMAYCLMHAYKDEEESASYLDAADAIYKEIEEKCPLDAVSRFRRGQVLRRKGDIPGCIERFLAALAVVDNDPRVSDRHWVRSSLYRQIGFAYWRKAQKDEGSSVKENLEKAIDFTQKAYSKTEGEKDQQLSLNNIAYYYWEYYNLFGEYPPNISKDDFSNIVDKLALVIKNNPPFQAHTSYDTLWRCYLILDKKEQAKYMLQQSRQALSTAIRQRAGLPEDHKLSSLLKIARLHLSADEMEALEEATEELANINSKD